MLAAVVASARPLRESSWIDGVSEQAALQCAVEVGCSGVVEFCQEWAPKFVVPETPRECVIEMMLGIEEDRKNAKTLGLTFEEYEDATPAELDDRACALGVAGCP